MKFFVDTANIDEIRQAKEWGFCDGVTTNPSLVVKEGKVFKDVVKEICKLVDPAPVSAEAISPDLENMVKEARAVAAWAKNVVVKIPMTEAGLQAVRLLAKDGIACNVTLVFSVNQALLAAKAGAAYVSPFVGRLDDVGEDGMALIADIMQVFKQYNFKTQVIVASVRNTAHVTRAALLGAHVSTIPFSVIKQLFRHPLTDKGIERFNDDWKKLPESARKLIG
ncbi:MAG TPA: fructose-6-phosphate aldolase [Elusimicrobiota bacterium]|nr:fructose-6-phosphate aldolase [Elusimicrobiota bacterium]